MSTTAWQKAKRFGLSLRVISDFSEVPVTTLRDWSKSKPKLFNVVCSGVKTELKQRLDEELVKHEFLRDCGEA